MDGGLGLQGVVDFGFDGDADFMNGGDFGGFDMDDTGFTGFSEDPFAVKPKPAEATTAAPVQTG